MDGISHARYVIVMAYLCCSALCDNSEVFTTATEHWRRVTAGQRVMDVTWRLSISVSTPTVSDDSTSNATFSERNAHTRENTATNSVSESETTDHAPTIIPGCRDGNATHLCTNAPAGPELPHGVSFPVIVINRVQLAITCVGFFANAATYLTLTFNGGRFSPLILLLIKHQSLLDTGACGMGSLYLFLPLGNWLTGSRVVDFVVCHTWHNQIIFWTCVSISAWNLVLIGVERYAMICKPFVYGCVTRRHIFYSFAVLYVGCLVCLIPSYLQMDVIDGECSLQLYSEGFWNHFYYGYSFFIMLAFYILPVAAFTFLYVYVA